jgi:hypothetical protein
VDDSSNCFGGLQDLAVAVDSASEDGVILDENQGISPLASSPTVSPREDKSKSKSPRTPKSPGTPVLESRRSVILLTAQDYIRRLLKVGAAKIW